MRFDRQDRTIAPIETKILRTKVLFGMKLQRHFTQSLFFAFIIILFYYFFFDIEAMEFQLLMV
jgi:hypothetical protein